LNKIKTLIDKRKSKGKERPLSLFFFNFVFLFLVFFLSQLAESADFIYDGPDCHIIYRFKPRTGTLSDLTLIYNKTFKFIPAEEGGISRFILNDQYLMTNEGKHVSEVIEESYSNKIYKARFRWSYQGKSFTFLIKISRKGKTLKIEFKTSPKSDNVVDFTLGRSLNTLDSKVIELPYGHNVLFTNGIFISAIIDPLSSNASSIFPLKKYYSNSSCAYGYASLYRPLTDGRRRNLREVIILTVSPEISDTFFFPPNPISIYRKLLSQKIVIDLWRNKFRDYADDLKKLASMGMKDLLVLIHMWQKYGYDNGLPTTYPAGISFGGERELLKIVDICESNGYLFALHTNYVDFYENSDVWNPNHVALNPDGTLVKSWYNYLTGFQSYLMKPSRSLFYARLYEPLIHNSYRTSASFLDVHSGLLPSFKVDFDARIKEAGMQLSTFNHYRNLFSYLRKTHQGPLSGEGFGFSASLWAGHIDSIEADPRSLFQVLSNQGGLDVPLIVDYKLKVLHRLFVPHGAGYLERFFLNKWNDYTKEELEKYRVSEIAFGNAGFIHNPFAKEIPEEEIMREYCFLKHIQRYYLNETPLKIYYLIGNELLNLSDAMRKILPNTPAEDINSILNEKLSMVKILYTGGLVLYVNRSEKEFWDQLENFTYCVLPPNGFLAFKEGEFLAYSALIDGEKQDFIFPGEPGCFESVYSSSKLNLKGKKVRH